MLLGLWTSGPKEGNVRIGNVKGPIFNFSVDLRE